MQNLNKNKRFATKLPSLTSKARQAWTLWAVRGLGANRVTGKKGLSNIVVNLMLIVVSLAAVSLTASFVMPFLAETSNIQQSPDYACIDLTTLQNKELEITRACHNQVENRIEIDIVRSVLNEIIIDDITFQLDTSTYHCGLSCAPGQCIIQDKGSKKTYYFPLNSDEQPSTTRIFINACELDEVPIRNC